MAHRLVTTWWLHITQSHKKLQYVNNAWPLTLKYPCANISPNLFLQKCKQQHLDKVKTPWVLDGASNGGHSVITNLLRQLTKSNILWFLLLTLKNPCANMDSTLFFQKCKQQYWDKMKWKHHGYLLAHQIVAIQWLHIYCVNSQKVTFCNLCLTFDPKSFRQDGPKFIFSKMQAAVQR